MQIQLTQTEIELLEAATRRSPPLALRSATDDADVRALLLAMRLVVQRDGILEITLLGLHVLKLSRGVPGDDGSTD